MDAGNERAGRAGGARPPRGASASALRRRVLRVVQGLAGVWLLAMTALLDSPSLVVEVKDALAGSVIVAMTLAATASSRARRWEAPLCLAVGATLIVAAALLGFGTGVEAAARQWSQVVVGVLLVGLWSARTP